MVGPGGSKDLILETKTSVSGSNEAKSDTFVGSRRDIVRDELRGGIARLAGSLLVFSSVVMERTWTLVREATTERASCRGLGALCRRIVEPAGAWRIRC